jgi:hypothetical protein
MRERQDGPVGPPPGASGAELQPVPMQQQQQQPPYPREYDRRDDRDLDLDIPHPKRTKHDKKDPPGGPIPRGPPGDYHNGPTAPAALIDAQVAPCSQQLPPTRADSQTFLGRRPRQGRVPGRPRSVHRARRVQEGRRGLVRALQPARTPVAQRQPRAPVQPRERRVLCPLQQGRYVARDWVQSHRPDFRHAHRHAQLHAQRRQRFPGG